jgi:hypothetical protein
MTLLTIYSSEMGIQTRANLHLNLDREIKEYNDACMKHKNLVEIFTKWIFNRDWHLN